VGVAAIALFGRERNQGKKLLCMSSQFNGPCMFKEEVPIPLGELLKNHYSAIRVTWDSLLGIMSGGSSVLVIRQGICNQVRTSFFIALSCE
jgi:NADH dehydrogenase (ubiquinone) flavoprotein 1